MSTFANAVQNQEARTWNGMKARATSANACVDLFYKIGASRGKDIIPAFVAALVEQSDYALRIAQWARDIRGGAGERQLFKDILSYLEKTNPETAIKMILKIPEIGRWDDMLIEYSNREVEAFAFNVYLNAIREGNGLAAKWAPRKGIMAVKLRKAWGVSPKQYRKTIVNLTNVVETAMCEKLWDSIAFSKLPSLAHARYKSAFYRNAESAYSAYVEKLKAGDKSVKINAGAVYPYDVTKGFIHDGYFGMKLTQSQSEIDAMIAQWEALPNFMGDANVLPLVDVSGSMDWNKVGGNANLSCLEIAVSLGLYCADKNKGKFKDMFLTFSSTPELLSLKGNIAQKIEQMVTSNWSNSTNLHAALDKILDTAINSNVPESEMPKTLVVFSDMQFNSCVRFDDSALQMISRKYETAGYTVPQIVFWNLNAASNAPAQYNQNGVALVSGFSPAVMKSILKSEDFSPEAIMLQTIMNERYVLS